MVSGGGGSQPNFRELDDVFLQTQTRIWLGEVLNMRFDEQMHISDLLADGDLLSEVSKVIWNMLSAKYEELSHMKYKPAGLRKSSSGRYKPYSNVDSFLKICEILGVESIDLFTPSDVVEKRNIRKVCICLRALSKKLRSKQLKVPNFDMVTYSVAMPKDMVGGIRRSLEPSRSSISSSSSYSSNKDQRPMYRQRKLTEACDRNYDSCSEDSDEAESKYTGEESCCSSTNDFKDNSRKSLQTTVYQNGDEHEESIGDSAYDNEAEGDYISDYLAFAGSVISRHEGDNTPVMPEDEDDNVLNFFKGIDSFRQISGQALQDGNGERISDDIEDVEVSSVASASSVLGRTLNLEIDDNLDIDVSLVADRQRLSNSRNNEISEGVNGRGAHEHSIISNKTSINESSVALKNSNEDYQTMEEEEEEEKGPSSALDGSNNTSIHHHSSKIPNKCDTKGTPENAPTDNVSQRVLLKTVKTVASGTAVVGLLFLVLRYSRRESVKNGDANVKLVRNKLKGRDNSDREAQFGATARVHPAERLKFKN